MSGADGTGEPTGAPEAMDTGGEPADAPGRGPAAKLRIQPAARAATQPAVSSAVKLARWRAPRWRGRWLGAMVDLLGPASPVIRRGRRHDPRVALTFDDGPDHRTDEYLAVLARFRARATFFVIGEAAAQRPQAIARIAAAGHELAVHGYTHRPFPALRGRALREELSRTAALLPHPRLVRPPRGALSIGSVARCLGARLRTVLWSLDSDDCRTTSARQIAATVAKASGGEIVLLHEGQDWTLAALPRILEGLAVAGLAPVTVSELLR
jgi:peptidoglycan/xylan/chitin deacetylase (PgdA/CDA1 family)